MGLPSAILKPLRESILTGCSWRVISHQRKPCIHLDLRVYSLVRPGIVRSSRLNMVIWLYTTYRFFHNLEGVEPLIWSCSCSSHYITNTFLFFIFSSMWGLCCWTWFHAALLNTAGRTQDTHVFVCILHTLIWPNQTFVREYIQPSLGWVTEHGIHLRSAVKYGLSFSNLMRHVGVESPEVLPAYPTNAIKHKHSYLR